MKKINILVHAFADYEDFNAQNANAREIAFRLNPDMFNIAMFYKKEPERRLTTKRNISLIHIPTKRKLSNITTLKYMLSKQYQIMFYIRNFRVDYYYLKIRKYLRDKKITIYIIENILPYPASEEYRERAKDIALMSDYIFSVSNFVALTAKKEYDIDTPVIPVGVDTSFFRPLLNSDKEKKSYVDVLYVGSLQERKRPYLVLEAAKKYPSAKFHIVGRGPLKQKLLTIKEKHSLSNVLFYENVPLSDLIRLYQTADIFLFPSIKEGLPKVTLEAASCGLPVIVFDAYHPESVINEKTGFVVKTEEEMLEKLGVLLEDKELRQALGKNGREFVKQKYDWAIITKQWEDVFLRALNQ